MARSDFKTCIPRVLVLALALAIPASGNPGASDKEPLDFISQTLTLFHLGACAQGGEIPPRFDAAMVLEHCRKMEDHVAGYRRGWLALAAPYIGGLRPAGLPRKVVYPFGGGDLISALATFPDADEFTLVSLEPAGDPRRVDSIAKEDLEKSLGRLERNIGKQFKMAHSRTDTMTVAARDPLPSQLLFALVALVAHGYEPVSLRYFELLPDGELSYLTADGLAEADKVRRRGTSPVFRNMELSFKPFGSGPSARVRVFRHFAVDLGDANLKKNPGLLRHLEAKGKVAAMTKAASYLLWERSFSLIRDYLLENMAWMISDSTGIPLRFAQEAGFVQDTYGRFLGPFLEVSSSTSTADFVSLWRSQPLRRLPFEYGYPDVKRNLHLMVTRRPAPAAGPGIPGSAPPAFGSTFSDAGFSVSFSSPAFITDAGAGVPDRFLRLQNYRLDPKAKALKLDEGTFWIEFFKVGKGTRLKREKIRSDWRDEEPFLVDGLKCRRFRGWRGFVGPAPFGPDTGILCRGGKEDLYVVSSLLAPCGGADRSSACGEAARITGSIRLDPKAFPR